MKFTYQVVGQALLRSNTTNPLDVAADALLQAGVTEDDMPFEELDDIVRLMTSNDSPCWICGEGAGSSSVEWFFPTKDQGGFYAHMDPCVGSWWPRRK